MRKKNCNLKNKQTFYVIKELSINKLKEIDFFSIL